MGFRVFLYNVLQFALYDGSQNGLNESGRFNYTCFDNYFIDKYKGCWEVEPIKSSEQAYSFWKKTIEQYTNNKYETQNVNGNKIFTFKK